VSAPHEQALAASVAYGIGDRPRTVAWLTAAVFDRERVARDPRRLLVAPLGACW
jgi:hypothetical protein